MKFVPIILSWCWDDSTLTETWETNVGDPTLIKPSLKSKTNFLLHKMLVWVFNICLQCLNPYKIAFHQ